MKVKYPIYTIITPAQATKWLESNTNNRNIRKSIVRKYAVDMKSGNWSKCTTPISFYINGELADGQHRLQAIVEANTPQKFFILRGLSKQDGLNIDTGLARTAVDAGKINGEFGILSNELLAVTRGVYDGTGASREGLNSHTHKLKVLELFRDCAEWAIKNVPKMKYISNAVVLSAIARAYLYENDKIKLKRFCEVLSSGLANNSSEHAAVALRNYLIQNGKVAHSTALWTSTFKKSQNAIKYFMQGKPLNIIKEISSEVYPLKD